MHPSINNIVVTGLVRSTPTNFSKDPSKSWWAFPLILTDKLPDGQPFHQSLGVIVFNKGVDDVVANLKPGDEVLIAGKLSVKNTKDDAGVWKTSVSLVHGINQSFRVLSTGNTLPTPANGSPPRQQQRQQGGGSNQYHAHRRDAQPQAGAYDQRTYDDDLPF